MPLLAVAIAIGVLGVVFMVGLAERAVDRARAQTAADAAALAGVYEGRRGADELADLNGADLVAYDELGPIVRVVVSIGTARAEALAALEWGYIPIDPPD